MNAGQILFATSLVVLALAVSGVNQCQKNYVFCPNCSVSASPDNDDDDGVTSTTTTSSSSSSSTTESSTSTTTVPIVDSRAPAAAAAFLQDLSRLGEPEKRSADVARADPSPTRAPSVPNTEPQGRIGGNWLGRAFIDEDDGSIAGQSLDSDGDGFSDSLERHMSSNPQDAGSHPPAPRTRLGQRIDGIDDDRDGVPNIEEDGRGLQRNSVDSDGDGANDGAEILSKSNPLDASSTPDDHDGDGLGSSYESSAGIDFMNPDTDSDGVRDDIELALGMNALENDSDHDGILDAKELALGSDPTVAE